MIINCLCIKTTLKYYFLFNFSIIDQSVPNVDKRSFVLKIFLKKITKTKPIENSTLAIVISNSDSVYKYKSSIKTPTIREYAYIMTQIISLVIKSFIKLVVFKKNKNQENQKITSQRLSIDCITIILIKCPRIGSNY